MSNGATISGRPPIEAPPRSAGAVLSMDSQAPPYDAQAQASLGLAFAITIQVAFWGAVGYFALRNLDFAVTHPVLLDGLGVVTLVAAAVTPVIVWLKGADAQKRLVMALTLSVLLVASALFLSPAVQNCLFGLSFVVVLTLMPASFYSFFRTARGYSLADEFISNLTRLGIADMNDRRRLIAYVREFDALYGPLDARQRELIRSTLELGKDELPGDERSFFRRIGNTNGEVRAPVMLATVLCALGWFSTLSPVNLEAKTKVAALWESATTALSVRKPEPKTEAVPPMISAAGPPISSGLAVVLAPEHSPAAFAFYGAYFFSLQLLFQRYMRRDLSSRSYVGTSMRLVLPTIGTWVLVSAISRIAPGMSAVSSELREPWLLGASFLIGALPLTVLTMVANVFRSFDVFSAVLPSLHARRQLSELDGLTLWHQARLEEEDVDNIPCMATVDLVGLMISTRISPNRLVDWVDQAILLRHLPFNRDKNEWTELRDRLEARGVRTASGLKSLWLKHGEQGDWSWLDETHGTAIAQALVIAAEDSPNMALIESWKGISIRAQTSDPAIS